MAALDGSVSPDRVQAIHSNAVAHIGSDNLYHYDHLVGCVDVARLTDTTRQVLLVLLHVFGFRFVVPLGDNEHEVSDVMFGWDCPHAGRLCMDEDCCLVLGDRPIALTLPVRHIEFSLEDPDAYIAVHTV